MLVTIGMVTSREIDPNHDTKPWLLAKENLLILKLRLSFANSLCTPFGPSQRLTFNTELKEPSNKVALNMVKRKINYVKAT